MPRMFLVHWKCCRRDYSKEKLFTLKTATTRSTNLSFFHPTPISTLINDLWNITTRTDPSIKSTLKPNLCVSDRFNYFLDRIWWQSCKKNVSSQSYLLNFLLSLIRKQSAGGTPRPTLGRFLRLDNEARSVCSKLVSPLTDEAELSFPTTIACTSFLAPIWCCTMYIHVIYKGEAV